MIKTIVKRKSIEWFPKAVFVQKIPNKYGPAKGFIKYRGKLLLLCENAILRVKQKSPKKGK